MVRTIAILLAALSLSGCLLLDATDLGYMATHHGRHIDGAPAAVAPGTPS